MPSLPDTALPDARQIDHLGREIAALAPRLRGSVIERTVRRCRAVLDASCVPECLQEPTLRTLIRDIRLSVERQTQGAQIGPSAGV
jgi:hypothetical protein